MHETLGVQASGVTQRALAGAGRIGGFLGGCAADPVKGTPTNLQVNATDSQAGAALTYSASGLPRGLSIGSSTGRISGTPTRTGTTSVTVTAKDASGASGTTSFSWKIT